MSRIQRPLGSEGSSDGPYSQGLPTTSSSELLSFGPSGGRPSEDDDRINPIAGLGLTDEQYNLIVQDIVNAETFGLGLGLDDGTTMNGPSGSSMMRDGMGMMSMAMLGIGEKRGLEDPSDGREGKRSRFEVIE